MALYTQRAVANVGSGSTVDHAFASNVTAGATLVVCIWAHAPTTITSVTDDQSNAYTALAQGSSGGGLTLEIWAAFGAVGGACTVTVAQTDGRFVDLSLFEYPASVAASTRITATRTNNGGLGSHIPFVDLTGAVSGDLVVGLAATTNFSLRLGTGTIGGNAPESTTDDSASTEGGDADGWLILEGLADGDDPLTVAFGSTSDDYYGCVAVAFEPGGGGGGGVSKPVESAARRLLRQSAIYRM
jgi:hypothetical protein